MFVQDQIIQPFYTEDGNLPLLLAFARQMIGLLDPQFTLTSRQVAQTNEEEPYDFERQTIRYGIPTQGFETVHYKAYEPKYGEQAVDEVSVRAYGLADEQVFQISCVRYWNTPRFLKLSIAGPPSVAETILAQFMQNFGNPAMQETDLPNALLFLTRTLRQQAWATARQWAEDILKHRPQEGQALFAMGVIHAAQKEYPQAESYLMRVLALSPEHDDACYNLGVLYQETHEPQKAIEFLRRSLVLKPENSPAFYQLGCALEQAGHLEQAIQAYHDAVRTSPNPGGHWGYSGMDFTQQAEQALARLKKKGT